MHYRHRIPEEVMRRAGALQEFAMDASIASIRVKGGKIFSPVVIVYPDFIAAIEGFDHLPFTVEDVEAVFQSEEDLKKRSNSSWIWLAAEKS
jgi:hypothetical protein